MPVSIRKCVNTADDYQALADVLSSVYPSSPISAKELERRDSEFANANCVMIRYLAEDEAKNVVGSGVGYQMITSFHPQRFVIKVEVIEPYRRKGIGGLLYDRVFKDVQNHNVKEVHTRTPEHHVEAISFLEKRGYTEAKRDWISELDLASFDVTPFKSYLERLESSGITITSLEEEKKINANYKQDLYNLHSIVRADAPAPYPFTPHPFEVFVQRLIDNPDVLPGGYFLALDGNRYIGESFIGVTDSEPGVIIQGLTGMLEEYRGRGIAIALKLHTIEFSKAHGYEYIKTDNDSINAPMLAINNKLGFVRGDAWIHFEKYF